MSKTLDGEGRGKGSSANTSACQPQFQVVFLTAYILLRHTQNPGRRVTVDQTSKQCTGTIRYTTETPNVPARRLTAEVKERQLKYAAAGLPVEHAG